MGKMDGGTNYLSIHGCQCHTNNVFVNKCFSGTSWTLLVRSYCMLKHAHPF